MARVKLLVFPAAIGILLFVALFTYNIEVSRVVPVTEANPNYIPDYYLDYYYGTVFTVPVEQRVVISKVWTLPMNRNFTHLRPVTSPSDPWPYEPQMIFNTIRVGSSIPVYVETENGVYRTPTTIGVQPKILKNSTHHLVIVSVPLHILNKAESQAQGLNVQVTINVYLQFYLTVEQTERRNITVQKEIVESVPLVDWEPRLLVVSIGLMFGSLIVGVWLRESKGER